jgi:hypothetical protein
MHMQLPAIQCRHLLTISQRAVSDLGDAHLALEPRPGLKTAGWLIGHLAVTGDFGRRLCGRTTAICPKEWRERFMPGSMPSIERGHYPAIDELREALKNVYADLPDAAESADETLLDKENPYGPTRGRFPTSGLFTGYLLAGHFGYHLGQLSAWRAAIGLPVLAQ